MLTHKIGITATELFACNPFRVLGVAVNSSKADIDRRYNEFLTAAASAGGVNVKTEFDFDSLPPISRDKKSLETAYAKLASNGYRCFAYADSEFTVPLNIDDVALNLRDITCYDCFLRCYMWLVVNDPDMEEHELWIQLCKYIDKLITSSPDVFDKVFDNRFPAEMIDPQKSVFRAFYVTFCEIILLPLKEMVRGSMKCDNASDILKLKGIDLNEVFEVIDIPQANAPKNGGPAPKLKLALKDGDEYFDISSGKMMSFAAMNEAKVESNEFAEAASSISADAIFEEPDESHIVPDEPDQLPPEPDAPIMPKDDIEEAPHPPMHFQQTTNHGEETTSAPKLRKKPSQSSIMTIEEEPSETLHLEPTHEYTSAPKPTAAPSGPAASSDEKGVVAPALKKKKRTSLIEEIEEDAQNDVPDTSNINLTESSDDEEEEQNLYTKALVQMLRANRSRNQFMQDVDTKHVFNNGENMNAPAPADLTMDEINMKTYNKALLDSPYEMVDRGSPMSLEEKYRNIKIDDMLEPRLGSKTLRQTFEPDAIEEFKKRQIEKKKSIRRLITLGMVALLGVGIVVFLILAGII